MNTIRIVNTSLNAWMDECSDIENRKILARCVLALKRSGFAMSLDRYVEEHFPSMSRDRWEGDRGDLKVRCGRSGRHIEVEMFGPGGHAGGPHRFERLSSLTRSSTLLCITVIHRIAKMLEGLGFAFDGLYRSGDAPRVPVTLRTVRDTVCEADLSPLEFFNATWGLKRYQRDDSGWPTEKEYLHQCWLYDGNRGVRVGTTVYVIHKRRLLRGIAYPNMNGMWWVDTGAGRIWPWNGMLLAPDVPSHPTRDQSGQAQRLREELDKVVKAESWKRVEAIGRTLRRLEAA